jgi:hypothetical protein
MREKEGGASFRKGFDWCFAALGLKCNLDQKDDYDGRKVPMVRSGRAEKIDI